jgi:hypothetical protein
MSMRKLVTACGALSALVLLGASLRVRGDDNKSTNVTFNRDVAPIFFKSCVGCHRPGELAPMPLLTYKDARPWARSIREKVVTRQMPPWSADRRYGHFSNDLSLAQSEIDKILEWVAGGAQEGDPADLPSPPVFSGDWTIGKPDIVLTMEKAHKLPEPGGEEYVYVPIPTHFSEDQWVQAIEVHPSNRKVVHHALLFVQPPEMAAAAEKVNAAFAQTSLFSSDGAIRHLKVDAPVEDDGCKAPLGGYAPGTGAETLGTVIGFYGPGNPADAWPEGAAKLIPAGSNLILQMHYSSPAASLQSDRTSVGLRLARHPPERPVMTLAALNFYFRIPPGDPGHEVTACYTLNRNVAVLSYLPHMHFRGKSIRYEALFPDGKREILLSVSDYNFNWQTSYKLETPVYLPKETKIVVTAVYDNSPANRFNPDATATVRSGDRSSDEMLLAGFEVISTGPVLSAIKLDDDALSSMTGEYEVLPRLGFTVRKKGGRLTLTAFGLTYPLRPESTTEFSIDAIGALLTFEKDQTGSAKAATFRSSMTIFRGRRVRAVQPTDN